MEDFNFEQMLDDFLPEEKKSGDIVEGIITRKEMEYSYLDLGSKKEGRIISSEIKDFNVGDTVEVKVLREDEENIIVSKFVLDKEREFASYEVNEIVTGKVDKKINGGYNVKVGKNNAFLPFSLSSFDKNVDYTGKEFKFIIKEKTKKSITVSRTDLVKVEEQEYFDSINEGDVVTGKVKEILDFGLIVSVDGNNGFVHVSELAWHNGAKALKNYNVNDKIEAKIIQIEEDRKNVKLSVKQLEENPWEKVKEKYQIGEVLERPITEVFDFGILVSLEKDIEGLLHISDISYRKVTNLTSKYNVGDIIKFKIIDFNDEKNRVSLSSKALLDDKWEKIEDNYDFNSTLSGKIRNIQEYGIFVELEEGIEVFIHKNEFSWDRKEEKVYKKGDTVEFKVISFDKAEKKLAGSIKQLTTSPWKEVTALYKKGNKLTVKIVEIQENFVLVKLTDRFNGIIPKKELTKEFLKDISEKFSVGDEVEAIIIEENERKKSIVLSVRKVAEMEEKEEMEELLKIYGVGESN